MNMSVLLLLKLKCPPFTKGKIQLEKVKVGSFLWSEFRIHVE